MIEGLYIRDASITNAKIGDLQVDTIKIAGKAVSQTVSVSSESQTAQLAIEARSETSSFQILAFRRGDGGRPHPALATNGELYVDYSPNNGTDWANLNGIVNVFSYIYQPNVSASSLFMMATTLVFSWTPVSRSRSCCACATATARTSAASTCLSRSWRNER